MIMEDDEESLPDPLVSNIESNKINEFSNSHTFEEEETAMEVENELVVAW